MNEAEIMRAIAQRVRAAREAHEPKITQDELGDKLGLSRVAYGHYERGTTPFSVTQLYKIARLLGRPIEELLGLHGPLRPDESTLLAAYRRLNGSVHQARVLAQFLDSCRIWADAPADAGAATDPNALTMPFLVLQTDDEGRLRMIQQGLVNATTPAATSPEEDAFLHRFRRLTAAQQQVLLQFLAPDEA